MRSRRALPHVVARAGNQDIAEGNVKLTAALLFALMEHYHFGLGQRHNTQHRTQRTTNHVERARPYRSAIRLDTGRLLRHPSAPHVRTPSHAHPFAHSIAGQT
jgi:hypothetical protein